MIGKKQIKALCLVSLSAGLLNCVTRDSVVPIETVDVSVVSLSVDSADLLGYACDIQVIDSMLYLQDTKGGDTFLRLYAYPSLRRLCEFVNRGKGPEEMLAIGGYTADADSVWVFASQEHKMAVYAVSDLRQGMNKPARMVEYPQSCMPTMAFGGVKGGFVLQNGSSERRLMVVDSVGNVLEEKYEIPVSDKRDVQSKMLPYLWQSALATQGETVVLGTRLGDVLEIYDLADSSNNRVIRGDGGEPVFVKEDGMMQMGRISGFQEIDILGDRVFALFDGSVLADYNGQDRVPQQLMLREYDLNTGVLKRVYKLDRYISTFDVLPDGRTVIAADPNSEHQLCTFTLPD